MAYGDAQPETRDDLRKKAARLLDVPVASIPRHIAIIMDGNGRWAVQRGLPRSAGHHAGAKAARAAITASRRLGIEVLTLYSFSLENWKRSDDEVDALMSLAVENLVGEREELRMNNIRLRHVGRREPLPPDVLAALDETVAETAQCNGMTLALALNYGARAELVDAVRAIAGQGTPANPVIDEGAIDAHLYTAGLPDPDVVVRTAGECRLSNFLLWQASYAELVVREELWPDFDDASLHAAIREYARRERRYGAAPVA